ncbi:MAG: glycosyltransferase family 1 protein [Maritimibacter sp.]|nr:glycosyltransferase family 1 protein [Maritimibacter sp.]
MLLKQDMSHVETLPDVFVADETYVPVRWDLADFEDKVRGLLADPDRCAQIAQNAHDVLTRWARDRAFVDQVAPIFGVTQTAR